MFIYLIFCLVAIAFLPLDNFDINNNKYNSPFYLDSPKKIFFLTLFTGGNYIIIWEYRHWRYLKNKALKFKKENNHEDKLIENDSKLLPLLRVTINIFSLFLLPRRIKKTNSKYFKNLNPIIFFFKFNFLLAADYSFIIAGRSDDLLFESLRITLKFLIPLLFSLQLASLQNKVNKFYFGSKDSVKNIKTNFNTWDRVFVSFGIIYGLLMVTSQFVNITYFLQLFFSS